MTENSNENQPSIMVPLDDLDKVPVDDIDKVDTLVQELATIRQSAKKLQSLVQETLQLHTNKLLKL